MSSFPLAILKYYDNGSTIVCRDAVDLDDTDQASPLYYNYRKEFVRLVVTDRAPAL